MTSGLGWKMAIAPIEWTGWSSKIGSQLMPPFVVFHTPPLAPPTEMILGSAQTASIAVTRPLMAAGPIDRALMPARRAGSMSDWAWARVAGAI